MATELASPNEVDQDGSGKRSQVNSTDLQQIADWVADVNRLGREIDREAASIHPSARRERLSSALERYRKLAGSGPERAASMALFEQVGGTE